MALTLNFKSGVTLVYDIPSVTVDSLGNSVASSSWTAGKIGGGELLAGIDAYVLVSNSGQLKMRRLAFYSTSALLLDLYASDSSYAIFNATVALPQYLGVGTDVTDTTASDSAVLLGRIYYTADGTRSIGTLLPGTDVTDTTAVASDVRTGKDFYLSDGTKTTGTLVPGSGSSTQFYKCTSYTYGVPAVPAALSTIVLSGIESWVNGTYTLDDNTKTGKNRVWRKSSGDYDYVILCGTDYGEEYWEYFMAYSGLSYPYGPVAMYAPSSDTPPTTGWTATEWGGIESTTNLVVTLNLTPATPAQLGTWKGCLATQDSLTGLWTIDSNSVSASLTWNRIVPLIGTIYSSDGSLKICDYYQGLPSGTTLLLTGDNFTDNTGNSTLRSAGNVSFQTINGRKYYSSLGTNFQLNRTSSIFTALSGGTIACVVRGKTGSCRPFSWPACVEINLNDSSVSLYINNSVALTASNIDMSSSSLISVIVTHTAADLWSIYVDGELKAQGTKTPSSYSTTYLLLCQTSYSDPTVHFRMLYRDIYAWNRVLSDLLIKAVYQHACIIK